MGRLAEYHLQIHHIVWLQLLTRNLRVIPISLFLISNDEAINYAKIRRICRCCSELPRPELLPNRGPNA